jgi:protein required for attachment to host cells
MAHLTLTGVSDDGKRLLLVSSAGVEFTIDIDPRLRAAVRGDQPRPPREQRPGHLENQMDSTLRPRDIQTRIRAGETPEAVAEAAQTTVDRIMAFAAPVMAERAHVADRAQRSSVRRRAGDPGSVGGARTLGEAVSGHLRSLNIDPDSVEWDAWRREDGRWTLSGEFAATKRSGSATFTYDGPGNYVTADNDDAKWLIGEALPVAQSDEVRDDLRHARERRLTPVDEDELPLGADAIELVSEPAPQLVDEPREAPAEPAETTSRRRGGRGEDRFGADQPLEAFLAVEPAPAEEAERRDAAADAAALDDEGAGEPDAGQDAPEAVTGAEPEEPPAPRRPVRKSRGRASVPSWDEIMFGGGKND